MAVLAVGTALGAWQWQRQAEEREAEARRAAARSAIEIYEAKHKEFYAELRAQEPVEPLPRGAPWIAQGPQMGCRDLSKLDAYAKAAERGDWASVQVLFRSWGVRGCVTVDHGVVGRFNGRSAGKGAGWLPVPKYVELTLDDGGTYWFRWDGFRVP